MSWDMQSARFAYPIFAFMLTAAAVSLPRFALADANQTQSFAQWKQMENCAKSARKQFPDFTPEGNAKREAARQACLRANRLPVTEPVPTKAR
jgi:hypothetical protein